MRARAGASPVLALSAVLLALPGAASAAKLDTEGGTVVYTADPGETNSVTLTSSVSSIRIADATANLSPAGAASGAMTGPQYARLLLLQGVFGDERGSASSTPAGSDRAMRASSTTETRVCKSSLSRSTRSRPQKGCSPRRPCGSWCVPRAASPFP